MYFNSVVLFLDEKRLLPLAMPVRKIADVVEPSERNRGMSLSRSVFTSLNDRSIGGVDSCLKSVVLVSSFQTHTGHRLTCYHCS